jgi:hypothetical protein
MYDLTNFTLSDMTACGAALRKLSPGARNMEEVARRLVHFLHDNLHDARGARVCALVRFFKTHPYEGLDDGLRGFARRILAGAAPTPGMKCLTLLASAGDQPEWNARQTSAGHQAIPLTSAEMLQRFPMTSQLVKQLGVEVAALLHPDPALLVDQEQKSFNVFHVADAVGSPFVPEQEEFVLRYGVRSVLGFGGVLPDGNLFVVILFARAYIPQETAELFKTLALSAKLAVLPFVGNAVFDDVPLPVG